jgi:hypothetical protein
MESLMREIGSPSVNTGGRKETGEEELKELDFRAAWEAMLIEGMGGGLGELNSGPQLDRVAEQGDAGEKGDFRQSIRQAMDRLKESESTLQVYFLLSS